MVAKTKTAKCPDTRDRALIEAGGWEWVDDGRQTPSGPGRHWLWYVVDVAVLVLALAMVWLTLGGDRW